MPGRNATGTNTAISTAVVAMIGPVTSFIAAFAAASGDFPSSICRLTFSTTTMASSTTSPIASTRPSRLTVLRENRRQLLHLEADQCVERERVGSGYLVDRHQHGRLAIHVAVRIVRLGPE